MGPLQQNLLLQINVRRYRVRDDNRIFSRSIFMKSPDQAAFRVIMIVSVIIALAMLPFAARAIRTARTIKPAWSGGSD